MEGSGLGFVIQGHTDHVASEERSFSSSGQLPYMATGAKSRHKNPRSPLIFRNGERLKNSTLHQRFLISENGWQIHFSPSVKLKKNTKFIACHPAPGKRQ